MFRTSFAAAAAALAVSSCAAAQDDAAPELGVIVRADGESIGRAALAPAVDGHALLRVQIDAGGLTPGWHGLHLHEIGDCSDIGAFQRAGSHIGAFDGGHGLARDGAAEPGDLPNIWVDEDGSAHYEAYTRVALAAHAPALSDEDGSAVVIHAERDDQMTQPGGGSGDRAACAVVAAGDPDGPDQ